MTLRAHCHSVMVALVLALAGGVLLAPAAGAAQQDGNPRPPKKSTQVIATYTLVAPASVAKSQLVARAVIGSGSCPALVFKRSSGKTVSLPMSIRPRPANTGPYFKSVAVCTINVPASAVSATIAGRKVPARLPANINRIAMFADTGCRIEQIGAQYDVQACNKPNDPTRGWPLRQIAASIAADNPDVILNPGDYFYREWNCPTQLPWAVPLCGGSPPVPTSNYPFRDSAAGWRADVFTPMTPLFGAAPIAMLRGNHEACFRAGNGFFYFLDPRPNTSQTCAPVSAGGSLHPQPNATTPTWSATLDLVKSRTLNVAMVDSAYGNDATVTSWANTQRPTYQAAANQTRPGPNGEAWLMTHRPVIGHNSAWLSADQTAASLGLLGTYNLVLSSHIHFVQGIKIPGLPPSLVMGNGGTLLDRNPGPIKVPLRSGTTTFPMPTTDWTASRWGYAIATPGAQKGQWSIAQKTTTGTAFARCRLDNRAMTCS